MSAVDWLSQLIQIVSITGRLEVRCVYGAPWRVVWSQAAANEIPYHVIVKGRAIFEDPETRTAQELQSGDIVLLPHGAEHVLHDGSGRTPIPTRQRRGSAGWVLSENDGDGEPLDLMCGRFFISPPHDRMIRNYMPANLVARAVNVRGETGSDSAANELASLVSLMRTESSRDRPGGLAMLNALSSALFTMVLRAASEGEQAPEGLLALAGHPRLAPAIAAMLADPTRSWKLPDLAELCGMSRATFMRQFQDKLGCSALDLLTDLRPGVLHPGARIPTILDADRHGSTGAREVRGAALRLASAIGRALRCSQNLPRWQMAHRCHLIGTGSARGDGASDHEAAAAVERLKFTSQTY